MNTCYICKEQKEDVVRRFGMNARGQPELDQHLCDACAEKLAHVGNYANVLKPSEMAFGYTSEVEVRQIAGL